MRFIPTSAHGVLDYASGLLLIVLPYLLNFADGTAAQLVPQVLGVLFIGQSLFTDYELSLVRLIPMPVHLGTDVAGGAALALSPLALGFMDRVYLPHVLLGLFAIGAGLLTRKASLRHDRGRVASR